MVITSISRKSEIRLTKVHPRFLRGVIKTPSRGSGGNFLHRIKDAGGSEMS
jgi:hypothetical protein